MSLCQDVIRVWSHFAFMRIVFTFVELFSFTWVQHNCVWKMEFRFTCEVLWKLHDQHHRRRSKQIVGGAKDFCPNLPNDLQKRSSCVFLQTLGAILWNQTRLGAILHGFSEILSRFLRIFNKSRGALAPRLLHYWLVQNFRHCSTRVWLHLQWRLGVSSADMSNPNGLLSQNVCHYLNQGQGRS